MRKVAVFGNAGGGKSTLAVQLARATGLPLYALDKMKFLPGGGEVAEAEYRAAHAALLGRDEWIIDGFGCPDTVWERLAVADTLIHVELPLVQHAAWVTKRLLKGLVVNPEGWPERSPVVRGSISSYKVLLPCHRLLTPAYRRVVAEARGSKQVFHLQSAAAIAGFLADIQADGEGAR